MVGARFNTRPVRPFRRMTGRQLSGLSDFEYLVNASSYGRSWVIRIMAGVVPLFMPPSIMPVLHVQT